LRIRPAAQRRRGHHPHICAHPYREPDEITGFFQILPVARRTFRVEDTHRRRAPSNWRGGRGKEAMPEFMSWLLAALAFMPGAAPPLTATGQGEKTPENQVVLDSMCRRWVPAMHRLMRSRWPANAPQFAAETARAQPRWVEVPPASYRRVLDRWLYLRAKADIGLAPIHPRAASRLAGRLLAAGRFRVWRTRLPVPFLDGERRLIRYREVTRIRLLPTGGALPGVRADEATHFAGYYYIVSTHRPVPAEIGPFSTEMAYLFLFRGQPYYLRPVANMVTWASIGTPKEAWPQRRYDEYWMSPDFGCDWGRYYDLPPRPEPLNPVWRRNADGSYSATIEVR
jgi:hypothetical protein